MFPFTRNKPAPVVPAIVTVRDRVIDFTVLGLLSAIAGGVTYIASTVPLKLQNHEQRITRVEKVAEEVVKEQKENIAIRGQMLGLMERMGLRFRVLEHDAP